MRSPDQLLRILGEGAFGVVFAAADQSNATHSTVAVKYTVKASREEQKRVARELRYLQRIKDHDYLHQRYDNHFTPCVLNKLHLGIYRHCVLLLDAVIHGDRHPCLIFEHLGMNLEEWMFRTGSLSLWQVKHIAEQVLDAISC